MNDMQYKLQERKKFIEQGRNKVEAIPHHWNPGKSYRGNIEEIAILSCCEQKPVKTDFQRGYIIPARSNTIDTELTMSEQQINIKNTDKTRLFRLFEGICEAQKSGIKNSIYEADSVVVCREIFTRFPEDRDKIDLLQTLRMLNILSQSNNPENQALLPEIEKDLQAKAWRYFSSERKYGEDFAKMVRPTPYSVSCIEDLKFYMVHKMNAPEEDVVEPKLKDIKHAMLSDIQLDTLGYLSTEAERLVFTTAVNYPNHENSSKIIENIGFPENRRFSRGEIGE